MSGTREAWTPERRAAQAARMRERYRNPSARRKQAEHLARVRARPEVRAAASARMKRLNARIRDDDKLRGKVIRGQKRVRRSPQYRAMQSLVMTDVMSRPENRRAARFHCIRINKNPKVRKRQWAGRRRKAAAALEASP